MTTDAWPREDVPAAEPSAGGLEKRLGLFDATMLVAGSMIGSGIFIVSADIARDVGSSGWLLLVWALTGVMTVAGALSYAELAAMMPNAGGQYVYLRESYGSLWGFLYGWTAFLVIQTGFIAAVSVAFAKFLGVLVPVLGTDYILWEVGKETVHINLEVYIPWMHEPLTFFKREGFKISSGQLVAVGVIAVLTWVNCRGLQSGKLVQNVFTVTKTLGLLLLIVLGLTVAANATAIRQNLADPWGGITTTAQFNQVSKFMPVEALAVVMVLCGAMVGSLFSSDSWNNVTFTAGEVKDPRRNLPLSLALGTVMVIVLYLLANVAYLAALPVRGTPELDKEVRTLDGFAWVLTAKGRPTEAKAMLEEKEEVLKRASPFERGIAHAREDRVGTAVLEQSLPGGVPVMAVIIMVSTFGCVNGLVLSGARLYYAMARDGLFFRSVGRVNANHVPAVGLVLQGAWSVVLVFSGSYSELLDYIIWAALFFYVLTVAGLFVLRRKRPEAERPYRAFGYPLVPALYVALCAVIMLALLVVKPVYSWPSFLIVLTGIPVYFLWRRSEKTSYK